MNGQLEVRAVVLTLTLALALPTQVLGAAQASATMSERQPSAEKMGPEMPRTDPSDGMKTLDAVAVRPVSLVSSVFSAGAFVLALPFAVFDPAMGVEKTRKNLVDYPLGYTFKRPLGDFDGSAW